MAPLRCSRNGHERALECPLCQGTKAGGLRERHPNDTHTHKHKHIVGEGTEGSSVNIIQPRNTSRLLLLYVHFQFKWLLMKEPMVRPSDFCTMRTREQCGGLGLLCPAFALQLSMGAPWQSAPSVADSSTTHLRRLVWRSGL